MQTFFSTMGIKSFEYDQLFPRFLSQSILAVDPLPGNLTVSSRIWMVLSAGPSIFWHLVFSVSLLFLPNSRPVHRRMFRTLEHIGNELSLVFNRLASRSFTHPVFIPDPFSSHFVPDTAAIVPTPHVFPPRVVVRVFFHFNCLCGLPPFCASPSKHQVLITVFGFSSQTHRMALHMLSAITSGKKW